MPSERLPNTLWMILITSQNKCGKLFLKYAIKPLWLIGRKIEKVSHCRFKYY